MEHPASELLGSEEAEWAFEDEWETKKVEVDESVLSKKARRSCTFFTKVRITYGGATHVFARGAGGAGGTLMPRLFSIDDDGDGDGPRGRRWLVRVVDLWLDEDEGSAYMAFSYLARAQTLVSRLDDPREYVEERAVYSSALDFVRGPPSLVTWEPPAGGGAGVFRRFEYVEGPKGPVLSKHGEAPRALTADPARVGAMPRYLVRQQKRFRVSVRDRHRGCISNPKSSVINVRASSHERARVCAGARSPAARTATWLPPIGWPT